MHALNPLALVGHAGVNPVGGDPHAHPSYAVGPVFVHATYDAASPHRQADGGITTYT
jgi:hypothetical protein